MKVVHGYIHHNGSIGTLVTFQCGTDFTARTAEFKELMNNVCMALAMYDMSHEPYDDLDSDNAPCVHDDSITVGQYLEQAHKLFKEPITILGWSSQRADEDYEEEEA